MDITKLLLTFWFLPGGIFSKPYCVHQIESIPVVEGGSVTIPCSFRYPREDWNKDTEIRVYWRSGQTSPCGNNDFIYNHTENMTHLSYRGRISMEGNPKELNTASIRIHRLKISDGPVFCCQVELKEMDGFIFSGKSEEWQNRHGTYLQFPDHTLVDQLDVVPAFPGETVTIPCSVPLLRGIERNIQTVTWRSGQSDLCSENTIIISWNEPSIRQGRESLVNFPRDVSLIIENVSSSDKARYCCEVVTIAGNRYSSVHGTELAVVDSTRTGLTVYQPSRSSAHVGDSVTINCSFTHSEIDPLWTGVYWRIGLPTGDYAYHPSQEMIHPTYRNRTGLTGQADLLIHNVQETDNTTYYCLVILQECVGNNKVKTETVLGQQGNKLNMTVSKWPLRIILVVRFIVFFIVILYGILGYRNVRSFIELKDDYNASR